MNILSKSKFLPLAAFATVAIFLSFPAFAQTDSAKKYVQDVGNQVLVIISNKSQSDDAKEKKLIGIFNQTVDTEWMSRFVLGHYYRQATPAQLKKYKDLYRQYVLESYVPKFRQYTGEKFQITAARAEGDSEYVVQTEILRPNQESVRVDYRLAGKGGALKIVDIIVEGVSLINTQRSEFGSVISREGFDSLITKLDGMVKDYNSAHG